MISKTEHKTTSYSASGKIMLFGEYLVLTGSNSLAFPTKYGQTLHVTPSNKITWTSESPDGVWFKTMFSEAFEILESTDEKVSNVLKGLFQQIKKDNPELDLINEYKIVADFNLNWGLGSSSTLISLLSQWSGSDPYQLLDTYFGGSGYDIACATAQNAVLYSMKDRKIKEIELPKHISDSFLFVYSGQKQSSKNEIAKFKMDEVSERDITGIDGTIEDALKAETIEEFEKQLNISEQILSPILGQQKLKDSIFADYKYSIKSLGAWGGDFFLATFRDLEEAKSYFKDKGFSTMFTYEELVK